MQRLLTIQQATKLYPIGKTSLYLALARGQIRAVKLGKKTCIDADSLAALFASLPAYTSKRGGGK